MGIRYKNSELLLERSLKSIPLGSQTFSKSVTQFPFGVSPYFINKAKGAHVWDADGNEYIDFINSLAAITIGYNDEEINQSVLEQVEKGSIYSLSHSLEVEVAEKIIEMVPCAEMVRYGKNGSDATAGAVRLARAYTGRDHILACGYHGWQDWYIGTTTKNRGVPKSTVNLTHTFQYNNINSLESLLHKYEGEVAAVIMEPMNIHYPEHNYLENVQKLTHENGALLIFDETVTGFRFANGGAQEYFKVIPDLATFGKGIANGYPLSAVVGKREFMKLFEEIFYSFTFGGELLSLAAANATLKKLQNEPVIETVNKTGLRLTERLNTLIKKHNLDNYFSVGGIPAKSFFLINPDIELDLWSLKTLFLQHMFSQGILILGSHNLSYAHTDDDIDILMDVYSQFFSMVNEIQNNDDLLKLLDCEPLKPLFEIRK